MTNIRFAPEVSRRRGPGSAVRGVFTWAVLLGSGTAVGQYIAQERHHDDVMQLRHDRAELEARYRFYLDITYRAAEISRLREAIAERACGIRRHIGDL